MTKKVRENDKDEKKRYKLKQDSELHRLHKNEVNSLIVIHKAKQLLPIKTSPSFNGRNKNRGDCCADPDLGFTNPELADGRHLEYFKFITG